MAKKIKHLFVAKQILEDNTQDFTIRKIMDIYNCSSQVAQDAKKFLKTHPNISIEELSICVKILEDV